jgi:hypothetical protein
MRLDRAAKTCGIHNGGDDGVYVHGEMSYGEISSIVGDEARGIKGQTS